MHEGSGTSLALCMRGASSLGDRVCVKPSLLGSISGDGKQLGIAGWWEPGWFCVCMEPSPREHLWGPQARGAHKVMGTLHTLSHPLWEHPWEL